MPNSSVALENTWRSLRESNPSFQIEKPPHRLEFQGPFRKFTLRSRADPSKAYVSFRNATAAVR